MQTTDTDVFAIRLTEQELAYVLDILRGRVQSTHETQAASGPGLVEEPQEARNALEARRFLEIRDGSVVLDETVAAMVSMTIKAGTQFSITHFQSGESNPRQLDLFAGHGLVVEQTRHVGSASAIELAALASCPALIPRILSFLQIAGRKVIGGSRCRLVEQEWTELPYLLADGDVKAGIDFLLQRNVDKKTATRLATALAHPQRLSHMQHFDRRQSGTRTISHLTVIEDVYGYWLVHPIATGGHRFVKAQAVDAEAVREALIGQICRHFRKTA